MESTYSLWMDARARLSVTPSAEEALCNLGMLAFVASHLFSASGWQESSIAELLFLIERLDELHTKVQGMILTPLLAATLL